MATRHSTETRAGHAENSPYESESHTSFQEFDEAQSIHQETRPLDDAARLYRAALSKAQNTLDWYKMKMASNKRWSRLLHILAVLMGILTGITPIVLALLDSEVQHLTAATTIFAALGATLVGIDRYLGIAATANRLAIATTELETCVAMFQRAWAARALSPTSEEPLSPAAMQARFDLIQGFVVSINRIILGETHAWATRFHGPVPSRIASFQGASPPVVPFPPKG